MMFALKDIIKATNAKARGNDFQFDVKSISTDSRCMQKGGLFIALNGKNFTGADFIKDAVKKGATAVMLDKTKKFPKNLSVPALIVDDAQTALAAIAGMYRKRFRVPFIAVVGSNGKTTTKDMLAHIMGENFNVLKTDENCNNKIGVAKTLLRFKGHDIAIIESGTSLPGEIKFSGKIIKPNIVITTNIGASHLQGLKNIEGVLKEKIAMVECLEKSGVWIRNCDDNALLKKEYQNIKTIDFGIKNKEASFRAESIKFTDKGTGFCIGKKDFFVPLLGMHNVYNSLAAIAASSLFMDLNCIKKRLASFKGASMRMQVHDCNGFRIINDAYNANPDSFKCAVETLKEFKSAGKRIFVCADMLELGREAENFHYLSGQFLAKSNAADILIVFGKHATAIARGALEAGMNKDCIKEFYDKKHISDFLKNTITDGDIVLVKGSRAMKMEETINCFTTCCIH
jgi:UDP-N-acetylmuramoyl-tripeptide--D-alanyl-D-alanine ligase